MADDYPPPCGHCGSSETQNISGYEDPSLWCSDCGALGYEDGEWSAPSSAEKLVALRSDNDRLRELLKRCEWPHIGGADFNLKQCPCCLVEHEYTMDEPDANTHAPDCELAAALAGSAGEVATVSHSPDRPKIADVLPLVQEIYSRHCAGCCLHIVLDDQNIEDSSVDFCIGWAEKQILEEPNGHHDRCLATAKAMRQMSRTQRLKLGYHAEKRALDPLK